MNLNRLIPKNLSLDDVLDTLGLERRDARHSVLPMLGMFAAGALVGGVVALMMAPSSGPELRSRISRKVQGAMERRGNGAAAGTEAE